MERIIKANEGISKVNERSLIFHPGFYLKDTVDNAYDTIKNNLLKLPLSDLDYRLETTGKRTQFGTLEELVSLALKYVSVNYVSTLLIFMPGEIAV